MSDWDRLQTLFAEALEHPPEERRAFLEEACDGDADLLAEVLALLEADDSDGDTVPAPERPRTISQGDSLANTDLGPYRLLRRIGAGGMGEVYLAERSDGVFERQVAVKILRRGMDSDRIVRRFEDERRILSRLDHPHIASLLDGGVTADGRPYFVMEYVDGQAITTHCDRHQLTVRERLELFRDVCRAVHHAHRNLVVHRDLKPGNILVNTAGEVKLLDFGIAKLLDDSAPDKTRTGRQLLTPAYAAPEQLLNLDVTTATDVYGLGVVLYELLTDRRPYEPVKSATELRDEVLSGNAPRPSMLVTQTAVSGARHAHTLDELGKTRSVSGQRLRQMLRGDLDTICLKAIRPEPADRYASAEQFADDVDRHLSGQPVRARQGTMAYRARKFIRRHRVGVAVSLLALVGFVVFGLYHVDRLAAERDAALLQEAKANEVVRFVIDLFAEADPDNARGEEVTARQILEAGRRQVDTELENQPELRATMKRVLGEVYYSLGNEAEAQKLLEEALDGFSRTTGPDHSEAVTARLRLGQIAQNAGDYEASRTAYDEAMAARVAEYGPVHEQVYEVLAAQAFLEETVGEFEAAEAKYQEALAMAEQLYPGDDILHAKAIYDLAGFYRTVDQPEQAEPMLREVIAMTDRMYDGRHPQAAKAMRQLAGLLRNGSRFEEAEPLYEEVIALQTELLGPEHYEVAVTWNSYSQLFMKTDRQDEALAANEHFVGIIERNYGMHPSLGPAYNNRAFMLSEAGRYEEALENFEKSLEMQDAVGLPPRHFNRSFPTAGIAQVYQFQNRHAEAVPIFRDMLEIRREFIEEDHRLITELKSDLGGSLLELGELAEAEALLVEAHEKFSAREPDNAPRVIEVRRRLVKLYETTDRPELAAEMQALVDAGMAEA